MKLRLLILLSIFVPALSSLCPLAIAQREAAVARQPITSCPAVGTMGAVALASPRQATSQLSLCEGRTLGGSASRTAQAQPLALASGDFDEDGVPDLISGFADGKAGLVTMHRGNVRALWPYSADLRTGPPAAFFPTPRTISVPEMPDFIATGDFDADGHWDIVIARRGGDSLYLLHGDGHGAFHAAKKITLGGTLTAMISGETNRRDGLADLVVGVTNSGGSQVQVYESPRGALSAPPEVFRLSQPVSDMALGRFDAGAMNDLAVAAGDQLVVIHARDRMLSSTAAERTTVAQAKMTVQEMGFPIKALVSGDFTGAGPSIAALDDSGKVHILQHAISSDSPLARSMEDPDVRSTFQLSKPGKDGQSTILGGTITPGTTRKLAALRESVRASRDAEEWTERTTISLPAGFSQQSSRLLSGRVSGSAAEDILVADSGNNQIHVLSSKPTRRLNPEAASTASALPQLQPMRLLASLQATSAPVAVLPMRLSRLGLNGLVTLHAGQGEPAIAPQDVPPTNTFTVTNTLDITSVGGTIPDGSLRKAMKDAEAASGDNGGGIYEIAFNIPTTDPNYNAATGTFLIRPLSQSVPNALNNFALPPINATVIIDGYTQPGASPNTLANGDNAKILIQIDGSRATTPGGSGLVPFDDVGSVYRGLDFTGWTNPAISNNTASGAQGIEANGVGDFIEGNFFGTDPTGKTAAGNRIGIFADNGPLFGSVPGNIIGGTTPQARNLLSGNDQAGILFLAIAFEGQLQGNFIGTDITGNAPLGNSSDGVGLNGPTITIGGTLPGATNVIAGNGTNVDINDLTNYGAASNSTVQGNLIGTNASGTASFKNQGYGVSIFHNPRNMTIGGTTPAARNVISGNFAGVYIFDNSLNNTVQGNFIGTDITGTKALPNLGQGFLSGASTSSDIPASNNTIGGTVAGAGNLISGNALDGIEISGTIQSNTTPLTGNTIQGNLIGTDVTGKKIIPNGGNGVFLTSGASNNVIGGSNPGAGNMIVGNKGHGILIDPGTANPGQGVGNNTIANAILSNSGAGVRIKSGSGNRISQNSIFGNKALGIDLDSTGPNAISHCNASNSGANGLQNAPTLKAGSGLAFISATATDSSGNTSEFSNAVASSGTGNVVSLLGSFDGKPSTAFTIEFFSNTAADTSGFGQGQTYLGSTSVSTGADCTIAINNPVDTTQADVSVSLTANTTSLQIGPDFGYNSYTGTIANNGPATAHNVVFTDILPAGLEVSSAYCNVGPCQTPVTTSLGSCTVNKKTVTCNLGTMPAGATAQVSIPVQATAAGSIDNVATVKATETDPKPANNTSTSTKSVTYPYPFIDHIDPKAALVNTKGLVVTVYGTGLLADSKVDLNGTALTTVGVLDNQICGGPFSPDFCTGLQVQVPASLITTAGTPTITVNNPDPGPGGGSNFPSSATLTLVSSCTYNAQFFGFNPVDAEGDTLIPESVSVSTNAPTCPWTATSNASWLSILDNAKSVGSGQFDVAVAPNTGAARSGTLTVAGQTVEIDQAAGDSTICTYAFNPTSGHISATGGSSSFGVTTKSNCSYFVEPYPQDSTYVKGVQFITIPKDSGLLVGNGSPKYTVAANHGAPRTGAIMVGGSVFPITQDAPTCYYTLDSTSALIAASGGSGTIGVTASSPSCAWTAKSSDTSSVSITAGATGTGNGTVKYNVPLNTGGPQSPTITIGDATGYAIYSITQASSFTCTFTISPTPRSVSSNGTTDFFTLTASFGFCKWTAASNDPAALTITGGTSGSGSDPVYYAVGKNTTGSPRTLMITAGCQTFVINQDGAQSSNPAPTVTTLLPASVVAGSGAFSLTVNGTNFLSSSVVKFNGVARATTFVSATKLTAAILAADVATAGTPSITVTNPTPGGGTSNAVTLTVTGASNPVPAVTTLQPATVTAGSGAFTLTVNGSNFISTSAVKFNGVARATTFISATKLTAAILATDVTAAGTPTVSVTNPTPGGGTSNAVTFTITAANNPVPAITTLQPASVTAGSAAFTLTVNGTGFVSSSQVNFKGLARATTFVSATKLTAAILASDVAAAGTPAVTVTNPTPGGGNSNAVTFTITAANNPAPVITALQPATIAAGSAAFTLTVNGTGFVSSSVVKFNGTTKATTYVSATQVTAAISASDVANAGTPTVTVTSPAPGGGTSNAVTFTITAASNPTPVITSLQPASVLAGSGAFTLTVNGSKFVSNSVVNFNGAARTTTFVSATKLTASILATDIAIAGTSTVTVATPAPGGGTSNSVSLAINNPAPTVTALQPNSVTAGAAAFSLTVSGTGFNASSVVTFNGKAKTTTFVNSTQLSAAITAADVATAGTAPVSVTNPSPGGGTATSVSFTINVAGSPQASLNPTALAFPNTTAGIRSAAQSITLSNSGTAALSITGITIGGANPGSFSQTNTCGTSLGIGASCVISVTFNPASAAPFTAILSVADNSANSPQTATLSGTGIAIVAPVVSLTPASLSFSTLSGTTTAAQVATLKNTGNATLTISGVTLTGTNASSFAQTNTCANSLEAGASCAISITFTPGSVSSFSAALSVADNAAGSPHTISLTGTGKPLPSFTVSTTTTTQTIAAGGAAQYAISVAAQNGTFSDPVTLAASGLPTGATATFAPASLTPGSGSATSQLTIQTAAPTTTAGVTGRGSGWLILTSTVPFLGFVFAIRRFRRRWITLCILLVASLGAITTLSGCGGGFALPGASAKTYAITVTGTSGAEQQTTTVQLIVK